MSGSVPDLRAGRLAELAASVRRGDVPVADVLTEARARITLRDPDIRAFSQVFDTPVHDASGHGLLAGVPVAVKDNIDVAGVATALGRPPHERPVATRHAAVVSALVDAGAVVVGKTTMPEFACSPITTNAVTGATRNPSDPRRTAGGSSGGSAAAVAAGMVMAALGTDTGGSVIVPAALTGVFGLRPTHGALRMDGVFPLAWSLDTVGVFAGDPADLRSVFSTMPTGPGRRSGATAPVAAPRIGVLDSWAERTTPPVGAGFDAMLDRLRATGATLRPVPVSGADELLDQARVTYLAEMAAALRDLPAVTPPYAPDVETRRARGAQVSGVDYALARRRQRAWRDELAGLFELVDFLAVPTAPIVAPELGSSIDPLDLIRLAYPVCFGGVPAISIPCPGTDLPVGLMLVAPWHGDDALIDLAERLASADSREKSATHVR